MSKFTAEIKVGILVLVSLFILAGMVIYFGEFGNYFDRKSGYEIASLFEFTGGIREGAHVSLAGVKVGHVKKITVQYGPPTRVQLSLWLNANVKLTEGAQAVISSSNIMGDKYVELLPGLDDGEELCPGSVITGQDPVRLERLVRVGEEITHTLGEVMESIKRIIGEEESEEALRETIRNAPAVTRNLEKITEDLNKVFDDNRQDLDSIIDNFLELSETLKVFTRDLEEHPTILIRGRKKKDKQKRLLGK